jgi:aldose 1-epimerase
MTTVGTELVGVTAGGEQVVRVDVDNGAIRGSLLNHGARLVELHVPAVAGTTTDVVLGYGGLDHYEADGVFMGATCGRFANRIRRGRFTLDGVEHRLDVNEPPNHLHGGRRGYDRVVWSVETDEAAGTVVFSHESPDGDQGYPGVLRAAVAYIFQGPQLRIEMVASSDATTIVNLAHHSYWNLAGHDRGPIFDHELMIDADEYTPVDEETLPTGEIRAVDGTGYDFRTSRPIGRELDLDNNWVLRGGSGSLHPAAVLRDPSSGRIMTLETTEPGLQVYSGQFLPAGLPGKGGAAYGPYSGVALESQRWPDSPNIEDFPDCELRPGEQYHHLMVVTFGSG